MLTVFFFGLALLAQADDGSALSLQDSMGVIKQGILDNKPDQALKRWDNERKKLSCPTRIPDNKDLAQFWVYKGYIHYAKGVAKSSKKEYSASQEAWKKAFVFDEEIQLDESILEGLSEDEKENVLNFFEQNRRLTSGGQRVDAQVPENVGEAKLFVDGINVVQGSDVLAGAHLVQIDCPQDSLQSKWMFLENGIEKVEIDWFALCPSGVDTTVEVESNDMFAEMGFGSAVDTSGIYNSAPICHKDPTLSSRRPSFSIPSGLITKERMVLAGGGLLLTSGAVSYFAWTVPKFTAVEDARADLTNITEKEAAQISREFNLARWTTLGLLTAGIGVSTYGTMLQFQSTGNGIVITGQF